MENDKDEKKDLTGLFEIMSEPSSFENVEENTDVEKKDEPQVENFEGFDDFVNVESEPIFDQPQEGESPSVENFESLPDFGEPEPSLENLEQSNIEQPNLHEEAEPLSPAKKAADQAPVGQPQVTPAYPFSLRINGTLDSYEREKLVDLLKEEGVGIREIDLKPQMEAGKVLIPRVSEFTGIRIVHGLRDASVQFELGPSEEVFSASDQVPTDSLYYFNHDRSETGAVNEVPADKIPIISTAELLKKENWQLIDAIAVSVALKKTYVEIENSPEYSAALDALQRELKTKAFLKGANAVVDFKIKLDTLSLARGYRLTLSGSAVKIK